MNELSVRPSAGAISVYDRIPDPIAFIETMGKVFWASKAAGCQTEAEGKLLALACMSERMNPFEINKTYHLMDGKLSMRADAMLAKFRQMGGKFKWLADGEDGKSASLELTFDGGTVVSTYTIEQAKQANLVKDKGNWAKDPASMLRARVISRGIRMVAPEVIAGTYTPEELTDFSDNDSKPAPTPRQSKKDKAAPAEDVIDVEVAPAAAQPASAAPAAIVTITASAPAATSTATVAQTVPTTVQQPQTATAPVTSAPVTKAEEPPFETKPEVAATPTAQAPISEAGAATPAPAAKQDVNLRMVQLGLLAVKAGYGVTSELALDALQKQLQASRPGMTLEGLSDENLTKLSTSLEAAALKREEEAKKAAGN